MILLEKEINGRKFLLVQNSLIEEKTEAIVNPANEHLVHGGGVAGLIVQAGGSDIQDESYRKAPVKTGQAVYTTAGKLPFKTIIHTVGPIWQGGGQHEQQLLQSAVHAALELAEQLGLASVSLPAISTGIFGFPLEPAVHIIVETISGFLATEASILQEVHLCEFSADKAGEIREIITRTS